MLDLTPLTLLLIELGRARAHATAADELALHPDTLGWMERAADVCYPGRSLAKLLEIPFVGDPGLAVDGLRAAGRVRSMRGT